MPDHSPKPVEADRQDPLGPTDQLAPHNIPDGVDRRAFLMRSTLIGATAVMTGCAVPAEERATKSAGAAAPTPPPLSANLNVVKEQKGPVMTTVDEFYKVGPGPSSSHTIGPMRI